MPRSVDTVLTVAPDGTIGADFTGHVHAQGLDLDAGTVITPPDTDRIRWIRQSDGSVVADLYAWDDTGIPQSQTVLRSINPASLAVAALRLTTDNAGLSHADVRADAGAATAMVLNDLQQSDFLQLAGGFASRKIGFGGSTVTWPGGSNYTGNTVVNHGLGVIPVAVACMGQNPAGFGWFAFFNNPSTNTQFTVQGCSPITVPGAGTVGNFSWIAIG